MVSAMMARVTILVWLSIDSVPETAPLHVTQWPEMHHIMVERPKGSIFRQR